MTQRKVLLVGWDAADWKVINPLIDEGRMPTLKRLVETGVMGNLSTLSPALSPMMWTSIATGKRPFKHGIHGFSEPTPDGKGVQPVTNISRSSKAVWNILNQHQKKSLVVGWWPSHPAEPINGVMVSDFYKNVPKSPGQNWGLMKAAIHPPHLYDELKELRIHPAHIVAEDILPFVPNGAEIDQESDQRVASIIGTLAECTSIQSAATHLLATQPWDFAAVYFDAIDHFCHGFMKYHPPRQRHVSERDFHLYKDVVATGYIYHDMMLGRMLEIAGDDVTLILVSDHGFHPDHLRTVEMPNEPAGPAAEHRDYGIFLACGPGIKQDELVHGASLLDVTPTLLALYGLPVGEDMDGRPLTDIFDKAQDITSLPSWEEVAGDDGQHSGDAAMDAAESKEVMEQLIALGYIERPDENSAKAVADCVRELDYNLARSYMDADMHGLAIPKLLNLYRKYPVEFRFGVQLANCLSVMQRTTDLQNLVEDLNSRWRVAAAEAKKRLKDLQGITEERKKQWEEYKKIDEANAQDSSSAPPLARLSANGRPQLFHDVEIRAINHLKAVARGNPAVINFLSGTLALSRGDFKEAVSFLEKAQKTMSADVGFLYQLGNAYFFADCFEEAESAYSKALVYDDTHAQSLMGLCRTWAASGQFERALDAGQKAIGLKFYSPVAHFFVGNAKHALGDINGAIESYKTALKQDPNFRQAHEKLIGLYSVSVHHKPLAEQHRLAIAELESEQEQTEKELEPLDFAAVEEIDFEKLLPQIVVDKNTSFLPSLGQEPSTTVRPAEAGASATDGQDEIIIVSGLPRSGTSMLMQMLANGGIEAYTDGKRTADDNNPRGYYEAERVKGLARANDWLGEAIGKALKIVSPLVPYLPQQFSYRVIMMDREIEEIIRSQDKMLGRLDETGGNLDKQKMGERLKQHHRYALNLLRLHGIPVLEIRYSEAVADPAACVAQLSEFLRDKISAADMASAIDPSLYRERSSGGAHA